MQWIHSLRSMDRPHDCRRSRCHQVPQYVTHAEVIGHLEYNGISHRGEMSVQMPALWGREPENDLWPLPRLQPHFPSSVLFPSYPIKSPTNISIQWTENCVEKITKFCLTAYRQKEIPAGLVSSLCTDGGVLNIPAVQYLKCQLWST